MQEFGPDEFGHRPTTRRSRACSRRLRASRRRQVGRRAAFGSPRRPRPQATGRRRLRRQARAKPASRRCWPRASRLVGAASRASRPARSARSALRPRRDRYERDWAAEREAGRRRRRRGRGRVLQQVSPLAPRRRSKVGQPASSRARPRRQAPQRALRAP